MKNIKRHSRQQNEKLVTYNPYFNITLDYDTDWNCSDECESICRCSTLSNVTVEDIDLTDLSSLFIFQSENKSKSVSDPIKLPAINSIMEYCIDRLLRIHKAYDVSLYEPEVSMGYYGEEIIGYHFDNAQKLENDVLDMLFLKNDIERIFFVLEKEYSFLLPELQNCTEISIGHVDRCCLVSNMDYMKKIACNIYQVNKNIPIGLVLRTHGNHRLIDGYHRFIAMEKDHQLNDAKYIVLS